MAFLLDTNVLIGLVDPAHVQHDPVYAWLAAEGHGDRATGPATENAVMRIVGHPRYPNFPGGPATVAPLLADLRALPGHRFWPDDISIADPEAVDPARLLSSRQVTRTYLLGLARAHDGRLATFDRRLVADAVPQSQKSLHVVA